MNPEQQADVDLLKWLKKRKKQTHKENQNALVLEAKIAKGGKLRAYKEIIAYIETHKI